MEYDYAFEMAVSNIRFGKGATREVGMGMSEIGVKRVMVITDPNLSTLPPVNTVLASLSKEKIKHSVFDRVRIEPTDSSLKEAIDFANTEPFQGLTPSNRRRRA